MVVVFGKARSRITITDKINKTGIDNRLQFGLLRLVRSGNRNRTAANSGSANAGGSGSASSSSSGTSTVFESWDYALTDETTQPSTGVSLTDGIPYNFFPTDAQVYVTTAPTGSPVVVDILQETAQNSNVFASIFTTRPQVDVNKYTSVGGSVTPVFGVTTLNKGFRNAYKIYSTDSNNVARGIKVILVGHQ